MDVKYNWDTWQNADSWFVFNMFDLRPEVRRYFRTTEIDKKKHPDGKAPWYSNQKAKPRKWRAYYVGVYADYTLYSIKPAELGRQGWAVGIGLSGGYEIPLYAYKNGAVDLDLGLSAGLLYHSDRAYVLTSESAGYETSDAPQVFPVLPMLTEVRAVFSWRHKSISQKFMEENPMDNFYRDQKKTIDQDYKEYTIDAYWESRTEEEKKVLNYSDSLYRVSYIRYVNEWEEQRARTIEEDYTLDVATQKKLNQYLHQRAESLRGSFKKKANELKKVRHQQEKTELAEKKAKEKEIAKEKAKGKAIEKAKEKGKKPKKEKKQKREQE